MDKWLETGLVAKWLEYGLILGFVALLCWGVWNRPSQSDLREFKNDETVVSSEEYFEKGYETPKNLP